MTSKESNLLHNKICSEILRVVAIHILPIFFYRNEKTLNNSKSWKNKTFFDDKLMRWCWVWKTSTSGAIISQWMRIFVQPGSHFYPFSHFFLLLGGFLSHPSDMLISGEHKQHKWCILNKAAVTWTTDPPKCPYKNH